MASQPNDNPTKDQGPRRKWTTFEETVMMSLIIRNIHKTGLEKDELSKLSESTAPRQKHRNSRRAKEVGDPDTLKYVDVATALNRALHKSDYTHDIPVEEVEKLLHFFLRNKKGAIAVIDRQPAARLTRSTHRIWNRGLNFLGTIAEWKGGRKATEEVKRREDEERRMNVGNAGAITSTADGAGVAAGWGDNTAAEPSGDGCGAWGSGAANSSTTAAAVAADPWGASVEVIVESNSATAAWGEPEASETVATTAVAAAADWSVNEDPFATPLPPSSGSYMNKTAISHNAWDIGAPSASNVPAMVESGLWNETPAGRTDPSSDFTSNAWGGMTENPRIALSSITPHGPGKTADTGAKLWGTSAESLRSITDTAGDPWGTSAASSVIQPSAMDWGPDVSNVTLANSFATKTAGQAGSLEKPAPTSFADPWGDPAADEPNHSATIVATGWGEPMADTPYQPVATAVVGWGDDTEKSQGNMLTSQTAITAERNHSEAAARTISGDERARWNKFAAPAPAGWGPAPTVVENPVVDSGSASWASVIDEISPPRGMNSSNDFQNPSRQGSNSDKESNRSNQVVQVAGPGINPDRLAMLAAAETEDDEAPNFEPTAEKESSRGRKGFKNPSATFGSNDNAIPLKFNRLARK
ncbi:hypothetical protein V496_09462 [Pseudogymnoascus sp. VKM F-4515 (FW-2607)]|nr:hypothetical protein V496_09462 [Pseudogymnoascus sp. VKM F-4515 (FW-2607)]KFY87896.1 hypothetical protein V498_06980 [Pseudogymnoascus sp. VKM F-4517 (FW-2822)]